MKTFFLYAVISLLIINVYGQTKPLRNAQTQLLIKNLKKSAEKGDIIFGVANSLSKSYKSPDGKNFLTGDCEAITGQNSGFVENDFLFYDNKEFKRFEIEKIKRYSKESNIVFGYCWHLKGMNGETFRNTSEDKNLAADIVDNPESAQCKWFNAQIDSIIPVFKQLDFPVTFRPFHEMNGGWFWWGKENITPQQYIKLYRLLVDRIRNAGVDNVVYVWSPDTYCDTTYYPGDDYVDIAGLDVYEPACSPYHADTVYACETKKMLEFTHNHKIMAAICETGLREYNNVYCYPVDHPDFWTSKVFSQLLDNKLKGKGWVYVLSWYNCDYNLDDKGFFYIPFKGFENRFGSQGQKAVDDFIKLKNYKHVLFADEISKMY